MATSRKQAWLGNSSAMIHLFSGLGYRPVTASEKALEPYTKSPAHNWELFVTKAEPFRGNIIVTDLGSKKDTNIKFYAHTLSWLCRNAQVIPDFQEQYLNQRNTKYPSATTVVDGVPDEVLDDMRMYDHEVLALGYSYGKNRGRHTEAGLNFYFDVELLKKAFGEQVIVKLKGGTNSSLRALLDVGLGIKFTATFINRGENQEVFAVDEDEYFTEHSKRKKLPSFYSVMTHIYETLLPYALEDGYMTAAEVAAKIEKLSQEKKSAEQEQYQKEQEIIASIKSIGLPNFVKIALEKSMPDGYAGKVLDSMATCGLTGEMVYPAMVFNIVWDMGMEVRPSTKIATHASMERINAMQLLHFAGVHSNATVIELNDPSAKAMLERAFDTAAPFLFHSFDVLSVLQALHENTFGTLKTSGCGIAVSRGGYGVTNITFYGVYKNIGFTVNFAVQNRRVGSVWI